MRRAIVIGLYTLAGLAALVVVGMGVWVFYVQNVEKPAYRVVLQDGAIEVRDYPALVIAEVTTTGDRRGAVNAGFRPLANYIFAKERTGDTIAMTAPVTQQRSLSRNGNDDSWTVQFIMPSKYKLGDLPAPAGATVQLKQVPASRRIAIRFSGVATDALIAEQEAVLRAWIAKGNLATLVAATATYAYYNDPFTPGPFRRNEVMFDVATRP